MKYYVLRKDKESVIKDKESVIVVETPEKIGFKKEVPTSLYEISNGKVYTYQTKISKELLKVIQKGKMNHGLYENIYTMCDIIGLKRGTIEYCNLEQNNEKDADAIEAVKTLGKTLQEKINLKQKEENESNQKLINKQRTSHCTSLIMLLCIIGIIIKTSNDPNYINYLINSPKILALHGLFVAAMISIKHKQYKKIKEAKTQYYLADYYKRGYQDDYTIQKANELEPEKTAPAITEIKHGKSNYETPQLEIVNNTPCLPIKERISKLTPTNQIICLRMILAGIADIKESTSNYELPKQKSPNTMGFQKSILPRNKN